MNILFGGGSFVRETLPRSRRCRARPHFGDHHCAYSLLKGILDLTSIFCYDEGPGIVGTLSLPVLHLFVFAYSLSLVND